MLFETLSYLNGTIPRWAFHYARYREGCAVLNIAPYSEQALYSKILRHCEGQSYDAISQCIVRFEHTPSGLFFTSRPWPANLESIRTHGAKVELQIVNLADLPPGIKTTDRTPYDKAFQSRKDKDTYEVLLYNQEGYLIEGTRTNIVYELEGKQFTPPITRGVKGTYRAYLLSTGEVNERALHLDELSSCTHLWLTNAIIERVGILL